MNIVYYYLIAINFVAIVLCVWDKICAKKRWMRVSEMSLLGVGFIGGSIAMYLTMRIIHHKTRHSKFMLGLPVMILLQIGGVVAVSRFL